MGCLNSKNCKDSDARSRAIDKKLERDRSDMRNHFKLLLLGAGESGKSTIVKQAKIIHQHGFSMEERKRMASVIFENIFQSAVSVIGGMYSLKIEFGNPARKADAEYLLDLTKEPERDYSTENIEKILTTVYRLSRDAGFKRAMARSNEYQLNDSAPYFFDALDRITQIDYVPSDQDVLRSRVKTTGIQETEFYHKKFRITLCDVGGQRSERKKWIHCFQDVTAIIFVVALSEYDLTLREDLEMNRMHESLLLFQGVCENQWFQQTSVILFLNKRDLFEQKIAHSPLSLCFPDYAGSSRYEEASQFVLTKFMQGGQAKTPDRAIYHHFTCATDTQNVQFVFAAVMDTIIKSNLKSYGLL